MLFILYLYPLWRGSLALHGVSARGPSSSCLLACLV